MFFWKPHRLGGWHEEAGARTGGNGCLSHDRCPDLHPDRKIKPRAVLCVGRPTKGRQCPQTKIPWRCAHLSPLPMKNVLLFFSTFARICLWLGEAQNKERTVFLIACRAICSFWLLFLVVSVVSVVSFFLTHDFLLFYFFVVYLSFFLHFFAILVIQLVYKVYLVCSMYICCVLSPLQLSLFPHDGAVGGLGFQRWCLTSPLCLSLSCLSRNGLFLFIYAVTADWTIFQPLCSLRSYLWCVRRPQWADCEHTSRSATSGKSHLTNICFSFWQIWRTFIFILEKKRSTHFSAY